MVTEADFTEYLRTLVRGEHEANDRIEKRLDEAGWEGYPHFLAVVFFLAVDKRFGHPANAGEIIRFVEDMRAQVGELGPSLDQHLADTLIRSVLDESVQVDMANIDQEMLGKIQAMVVFKMLTESNLSEQELDGLLGEASRLVASR